MFAEVHLALYVGEPERAWRTIDSQWRAFFRSTQRRITLVGLDAVTRRGRCALAAATHGIEPARTLQVAERAARALRREPASAAGPMALLLSAGIAQVRGDSETAVRALLDAARASDDLDMRLYAALARRQAGTLLAGADGAELRAGADRFLSSQRIARPERMLEVLLPGFTPA
mgnify:CR=1 FL=1